MADLPPDAWQWKPTELVQHLQTLQIGDMLRLRMKLKSLKEDWTFVTATREENGFLLIGDKTEQPVNVSDDDEDGSLLSPDNWAMGWYSLVPPLGALHEHNCNQEYSSPKKRMKKGGKSTSPKSNVETSEHLVPATEGTTKEQPCDQGSPLSCSTYVLTGEQISIELSLSKESNHAQLYENVLDHCEEVVFTSKDTISIDATDHIFYYVAVPILETPSALEDDHFAIIFNMVSKRIECVGLAKISTKSKNIVVPEDVMAMAQDSCLSWLFEPMFVPYTPVAAVQQLDDSDVIGTPPPKANINNNRVDHGEAKNPTPSKKDIGATKKKIPLPPREQREKKVAARFSPSAPPQTVQKNSRANSARKELRMSSHKAKSKHVVGKVSIPNTNPPTTAEFTSNPPLVREDGTLQQVLNALNQIDGRMKQLETRGTSTQPLNQAVTSNDLGLPLLAPALMENTASTMLPIPPQARGFSAMVPFTGTPLQSSGTDELAKTIRFMLMMQFMKQML